MNQNQLKDFFPKYMKNNEIWNEIDEIKKWEEKIKRKDLKYETKKYIYDFQIFETKDLLKDLLMIIFMLVKLMKMKLR